MDNPLDPRAPLRSPSSDSPQTGQDRQLSAANAGGVEESVPLISESDFVPMEITSPVSTEHAHPSKDGSTNNDIGGFAGSVAPELGTNSAAANPPPSSTTPLNALGRESLDRPNQRNQAVPADTSPLSSPQDAQAGRNINAAKESGIDGSEPRRSDVAKVESATSGRYRYDASGPELHLQDAATELSAPRYENLYGRPSTSFEDADDVLVISDVDDNPGRTGEEADSLATGRSPEATSTVERRPPAAPPPPAYRVVWLAIAILGLLALTYALPPFVEKMQYALTRGRQRAEYEVAREQLGETPLSQLSKAYQLVSFKVAPSVVHINLASMRDMPTRRDGSVPFAPRTPQRVLAGQGSGVIVDPEGYVVTNRHVVVGSNDIQVKLSDGRQVGASIVGVDQLTDLAVLKINADKLIAAEWGDSDKLDVGGLVWALGSPFGLERSITCGILSAKHRADTAGTPYQDFLQTDAAVNPGNSGGPLVDVHGRVVGINTAIVGESYQGISFAIPSRVARRVYERIRRRGRVERGWLGVQPIPVTEATADRLGLSDTQGALVIALAENEEGSPAKDAGIQVDDVVVRWGDRRIASPTDLFNEVAMTDVGSSVAVIVIRAGREVVLNVVVGERSDS